ncbi:MAG: hypothetical protein SPJ75_01200 [Candidatus Onthomorpha sp.]|nr:hypothetical protein [Bacteroidales bacterium]MDD7575586.1 hypothetical protein [Bacteroidales bacterium]MDD7590407.1 hypothetical protein [Bacteroidales bacterium]MDY5789086.1 hypothetical protein [Candidatus Onthomorpha sp.]MDY5825106.1 hypothetical protein [Candidatus Onthomorpha sp.]
MKRTILYLLAVVSLCCGCDKEKNALREGNKQFEKKAFDKAESAYRNSFAADSLYKTAEYNLAAASYKQGKSDKLLSAAKYYESYLLSLDHNDTLQTSACTYDMANTYFQISQSDSIKASEQSKLFLQKAAELYKQSLRLNPQDTNAKYNLALTQHLLKEDEQQKNDQQQQQQQDQNQQQNQQQQQQKQQQQQSNNQNQNKNKQDDNRQMSSGENKDKKQMEKMLEALKNNEKRTLNKIKRKEDASAQKRRIEKDW